MIGQNRSNHVHKSIRCSEPDDQMHTLPMIIMMTAHGLETGEFAGLQNAVTALDDSLGCPRNGHTSSQLDEPDTCEELQ